MYSVAMKMGRRQGGPSRTGISGAYLNRCVTDESRSRRPIFIATLRAGASWLFFGVAHSTRMIQIWALYRQSGSDRLEKQPTDLRQNTCYFGDRSLISCLLLLALGCPLPASAQDLKISRPRPVAPTTEHGTNTQLVNEILLKMVDRWNAHDIEGLMSLYWNSPSLLAVIDSEQYEGWQNLYHSYKNHYRDPSDMGIVSPTRIQVQLLKPDLAFGILSWTLKYPNNPLASEVVGTSTVDLQKFDDGWKIVVLHMSFAEM